MSDNKEETQEQDGARLLLANLVDTIHDALDKEQVNNADVFNALMAVTINAADMMQSMDYVIKKFQDAMKVAANHKGYDLVAMHTVDTKKHEGLDS